MFMRECSLKLQSRGLFGGVEVKDESLSKLGEVSDGGPD